MPTRSPSAQQGGVARPVSAVARVVLDEVGVGRLGLADEHGDAQHGVRRVEQRVSAARALGEDEADEVGAGLDGGVDVVLAREAAHLHERTAQDLAAGRRPGRARASASSRRARRSRPASSAAAACAAVAIPLSAIRTRSRGTSAEQLELGGAVDPERREVARVDADHRGAERDRALAPRRRRAPRRACRAPAPRPRRAGAAQVASSRSRSSSSAASAPASLRLPQVLRRREEALGEQRQRDRRACRAQVVPGAAEALVDEHRHRARARRLVRRRDRASRRRRGGCRRPTASAA